MNEDNLFGHCTDLDSPYKFVQNYWVEDLLTEHERVKALNIGKVTEILEAYPTYNYFHLTDPDNNIIEVTGGYHICQSCGMVMHNSDFGKNTDGSVNTDYCRHCFIDGRFCKDETMEEMIESCIPFYVGKEFENAEKARGYLRKLYPTLKRWKNQ
ncbi:MAG: zinc ribbon domain-containing protein [Oscillospiraceae bacterium]|nr:zinc ribbon domain-containing protein [Oscillospiraceae bacterium]